MTCMHDIHARHCEGLFWLTLGSFWVQFGIIEPAERESRRAPRGKPARPCFWTHGKTTPRCSILGGPIGIQFCIQISFVFFSLSPWVVAVSLHFCSIWLHFGGLWAPFCIILERCGVYWASLEGVLGGGMFFHSLGRVPLGRWANSQTDLRHKRRFHFKGNFFLRNRIDRIGLGD